MDNEYSLAASFLDSLIAVLDTINESINETAIWHYVWRGEVQNQDDALEKSVKVLKRIRHSRMETSASAPKKEWVKCTRI